MNYISSIFNTYSDKNEREFNKFVDENQYDNKEVILLTFAHGGFFIDQNKLSIDTFKVPSTSYTLFVPPEATCSITSIKDDNKHLKVIPVLYKLHKQKQNKIIEFVKSISLNFNRKKVSKDGNKLNSDSPSYKFPRNYLEEHDNPNYYRIEYTKKGKELRNKQYEVEQNDSINTISGVIIINDCYINANIMKNVPIFNQSNYSYNIGILYKSGNKTYIFYRKYTNLLSCPYFIEYVKQNYSDYYFGNFRLYTYPVTLNIKMPCIYRYDSKMLHYYFKSIKTIVNIDTSCQVYLSTNEALSRNFTSLTKPKLSRQDYLLSKKIQALKRIASSKPAEPRSNSSEAQSDIQTIEDMKPKPSIYYQKSNKKSTKKNRNSHVTNFKSKNKTISKRIRNRK